MLTYRNVCKIHYTYVHTFIGLYSLNEFITRNTVKQSLNQRHLWNFVY